MVDITDIFNINSYALAATPTKSYLASYSTPADTNEHDTGITLSIPNGHQFGCTFQQIGNGSSGVDKARLYIGATVLQTWNLSFSSTGTDQSSSVYTNNTGSTQTAKITLQSGFTSAAKITLANIVEGSFVSTNIAALSKWGLASSLQWQFAGQSGGSSATATGVGGSQTTSQTTAITDIYNATPGLSLATLSGAFNTTIGQTTLTISPSTTGLIAWDFTGRYITI